MTYEEAMARLDHAAMFPKVPGLENLRALLKNLGSPEERLKFVHIAGTNGKGSTAAFLSAALTAAGYRTGLFCSPYVERFTERVQICGRPIPEADVGRVMARVSEAAAALPREAAFFDMVTALGLCYFEEQGCEIVVLEVGLGGKLDPTNVIPCPLLALITRIGLDHTAVLGRTVEAVAEQKAGIIKPGGDVLLLPQTESVENTIRAAAEAVGAEFHLAERLPFTMDGPRVTVEIEGERIPLGPRGRFQADNASLAYAAILNLREKGFQIPMSAVREGFSGLRWPGRFALLQENPPFVVDGAHNPPAAETLMESLKAAWPEAMNGKKAVFLVGMMGDKDHASFLRALAPYAYAMVAISPEGPRALAPEALAKIMAEVTDCPRIHWAESPEAGAALARSLIPEGGLAAACGSLYLCAAIR